MNDRHHNLLRIRPEIKIHQNDGSTGEEELFQNQTLRPIIKLQNPLIMVVFQHYIAKHKNVFYDLGLEKRLAYIENALFKDQKFRNAIKGMMIGQFTVSEYETYSRFSSSLNKRMINMICNRLKDQIQLFERPLKKVI